LFSIRILLMTEYIVIADLVPVRINCTYPQFSIEIGAPKCLSSTIRTLPRYQYPHTRSPAPQLTSKS
jgi:hypothetical protein